MAYATQAELEDRLAPDVVVLLADDDGDGLADADVITAVLADASATIDQGLAGRYVTPLSSPPSVVKRWCVDLAIAYLFNRKREAITTEHGEAAALTRRALEAIADGLLSLAGTTTSGGRGGVPLEGGGCLRVGACGLGIR